MKKRALNVAVCTLLKGLLVEKNLERKKVSLIKRQATGELVAGMERREHQAPKKAFQKGTITITMLIITEMIRTQA